MAFTLLQRVAGRRIKSAIMRSRMKRKMIGAFRKRRALARIMTKPGEPSFVETFRDTQGSAAVNAGGVFSVRITDIPQIAQYANLYKQYRINWVKVMLVPVYNSMVADINSAAYNNSVGVGNGGLGRIAYAINDSPQLQAPATEDVVLEDNGCKIKPLGAKWSASFKPVPDVAVTGGTTGNPIYTRQKYRQWFNFDLALVGNNPLHYGISYFITQASNNVISYYNVFYKVNFSLRDPQ